MSTNITNATSIDINQYLQIFQSKGVYSNLSTVSKAWEMILKSKVGPAQGRSMTYVLRTALGMGSVQALGAGDSGDYPKGFRAQLAEATAHFKFYGMTVNVPRQLLMLKGAALVQNADPLNEEIDAKAKAMARVLSGYVYRDGSGVCGIVSGTPSIASGNITVTLSSTNANGDRSHVGWFDDGDLFKFATSGGIAHATTNGSTAVAYWSVVSVDEDANTVTLKAYNSSDAAISTTSLSGTDPADGDYMYRLGTTPNDLSSISDYARLSEEWAGLPALVSDDGRTVHGLAHSGALKGTLKDVSGAQIDATHFQQALSKAKRIAGRGSYTYSRALLFDNVYDSFAESAETDRRFLAVQDAVRGFKKIGFQHAKDFVEFEPDEHCPKNRIWMLPDSKEVLQFYGDTFKPVDVGGTMFLKTSSTGAGHARAVQQYSEGAGVLICRHPASVIKIHNFTT